MSILTEKSDFGDMKYDSGKMFAGIIFEDFPDALYEVMKVSDFGAKKYSRSSWRGVKDALVRYTDAFWRHVFKRTLGETRDDDSKLYHRAHEIWNQLAVFQLELEEEKKK